MRRAIARAIVGTAALGFLGTFVWMSVAVPWGWIIWPVVAVGVLLGWAMSEMTR